MAPFLKAGKLVRTILMLKSALTNALLVLSLILVFFLFVSLVKAIVSWWITLITSTLSFAFITLLVEHLIYPINTSRPLINNGAANPNRSKSLAFLFVAIGRVLRKVIKLPICQQACVFITVRTLILLTEAFLYLNCSNKRFIIIVWDRCISVGHFNILLWVR
jgi:hypothetical protein